MTDTSQRDGVHARGGPIEQEGPITVDSRPLSSQVAQRIKRLIGPDGYRSGDRLPPESELSARFNVGRTTVREGLKLLEREGLIEVRRGSGRFVSQRPLLHSPITRLQSVSEMMTAAGYTVANSVLEVTTRPATADERTALHLPAGHGVICLERVRLNSSEPLIYSVDILPDGVIGIGPESPDWSGSLFEMLSRQGYRIRYAISRIEAVQLPEVVRTRYRLDPGTPWLRMTQINQTDTGVPIVYSHDYHRGDRFQFDVVRVREEG